MKYTHFNSVYALSCHIGIRTCINHLFLYYGDVAVTGMIADISVSNMVFTHNIANEIRACIRLPSICEGRKVNDIDRESGISRASMYRMHSKKREILTQVITTENVNYNGQNVDVERAAKLSSRHKRLLLRERTSY